MSMLPLGGMFGAGIGQFALPDDLPPSAPKRGGGMFGKADWGNAAQAFIGAYLAGRRNPAGAALLQQVYGRQQSAQQEAMRQQQRGEDFADWQKREQWKLENDTRAPHYFESNSGDQYTIGPNGQPQLVFKDPLRFKFIPNGMGGVVPVDVEKLMGGQPEILSELPQGAKPIGGAGPSQAPLPFPLRP